MNSLLVVTDERDVGIETRQCLSAALSRDFTVEWCLANEAPRTVEEKKPDAIILDVKSSIVPMISFLEKNAASPSALRILGLGEPSDLPMAMKLIRLGVKDFLKIPLVSQDIKKLFEQNHSVELAPSNDSKKIVTFYSPKGGSGTTFLTVNIGVALAKKFGAKVVLCDFSSQCGDIATYLNLSPTYTMRDIADNDQLLDLSFLEGIMMQHSSGIRIIASPRDSQNPLSQDSLHMLKSLIRLLKQSYDYILFDSGKVHPALLQYLISESTMLFLVGNPDVVSLKGLIEFYNKLKDLHCPTEKIKVAINRHKSKSYVDAKSFEKMTGHPIDCYVPNNFSLCIEAVNAGVPVFERDDKSELAQKIYEIASMVTETNSKVKVRHFFS